MIDPTLRAELVRRLDSLPPDLQRRVLEFANALAPSRPVGVPGKDLLRFAGALDRAQLDEMTRAIEDDCEQVQADEW